MFSWTRAAGGALLLVLVAACGPTSTAAPTRPTTPAAAPSDAGTVTRVIDGDTFEVGPRTVRVLGIDSCEAGTDAGEAATAQARSLLLATPVVLVAEPGVDRDRNGRELRYVGLSSGADYGTTMVSATHTAVYTGENDASPTAVDRLRAADANGRACENPEPTTTTSTTTTTTTPADGDGDGDGDGDRDLPDVDAPDRSSRDDGGGRGGGRVGRDGDGDGLCNESTVPVPC